MVDQTREVVTGRAKKRGGTDGSCQDEIMIGRVPVFARLKSQTGIKIVGYRGLRLTASTPPLVLLDGPVVRELFGELVSRLDERSRERPFRKAGVVGIRGRRG